MESARYTQIDRLIHRLAFASPRVQRVLADLEASAFGAEWARQPLIAPVFVTALPRAGTTLLLEILASHPETATHTYRDMPFVRAPILWEKLSRGFRRRTVRLERAHGDGMLVDPDSPEAFEEVVWLAQLPGHYTVRGIRTANEPDDAFAKVLSDHMRRIIVRNAGNADPSRRYLSKNNANIARIPLLQEAFPDSVCLVPLRDPLEHARSMHRQHMRFADMHSRDPFSRRYMADIGHFEFGALHKPILFDGVAELTRDFAPEQLEYWIGYWNCAYAALSRGRGIRFIDFDAFTRDGPIGALLELAGLSRDPDTITRARALTRAAPPPELAERPMTGLDAARALHAELKEQAVLPA